MRSAFPKAVIKKNNSIKARNNSVAGFRNPEIPSSARCNFYDPNDTALHARNDNCRHSFSCESCIVKKGVATPSILMPVTSLLKNVVPATCKGKRGYMSMPGHPAENDRVLADMLREGNVVSALVLLSGGSLYVVLCLDFQLEYDERQVPLYHEVQYLQSIWQFWRIWKW